jgi:hypothetical protein
MQPPRLNSAFQVGGLTFLFVFIESIQFGDGIMSMIDCKINVQKRPDPKGDRVVLTFERVVFHSASPNINFSTPVASFYRMLNGEQELISVESFLAIKVEIFKFI